jgi:hypothetical protein
MRDDVTVPTSNNLPTINGSAVAGRMILRLT